MTEDERNLDLMVAELEQENRLMRARNERLQEELERALDETARFKVALERIVAVSKLAFRDGVPERVGEVGETKSVQRQATGLL
jgi:ADP-ribose pyrophosphatase YjhB (NUDIX family)